MVVLRGADGTTAAAHPLNSNVSVVGATNFPNRKSFITDFSTTSLTSAVTSGATSLAVAAPVSFAWVTAGSFTVTIDSEQIRVTAVSGTATTLTVVQRGANGTTAAAHTAGSKVSLGAPLFVDTHGLRTDVPPTTLVVDNEGADITVYANAEGSTVNLFNAITVQVGNCTGATEASCTWTTATAVGTAVRIPGDGGHPIGYVKSYDITAATAIRARATPSEDHRLGRLQARRRRHRPGSRRARELVARDGVPDGRPRVDDAPSRPTEVAGGVGVAERRLHAAQRPHAHARLERPRPAGADPRQPRRSDPVHEDRATSASRTRATTTRCRQRVADSGIGGTLDTVSQAFDRIDTTAGPTNGSIEFHEGTLTERQPIGANATTVTLSSRARDPSLLVVIAEQALVSGTDFTTNAVANTVTLTGSITEPMVVRVSYPVVGGGDADAELLARAGDSTTLQLRNDLASGGTVTVTTYKIVTGFTVSGATLTVAASTRGADARRQPPAEQRTYFGGERAFEVIEDSEGRLVLTPSLPAAGRGHLRPVHARRRRTTRSASSSSTTRPTRSCTSPATRRCTRPARCSATSAASRSSTSSAGRCSTPTARTGRRSRARPSSTTAATSRSRRTTCASRTTRAT